LDVETKKGLGLCIPQNLFGILASVTYYYYYYYYYLWGGTESLGICSSP
jgi:hypothetical protein